MSPEGSTPSRSRPRWPNIAAEVKLVPPFPGAKDVTDWKKKGGTKEKLEEIVANTKPFKRDQAEDSVLTTSEAILPDDWRSRPLRGTLVVRMLESFFLDYVILPVGVPFVLAVWALGTYVFDIFDSYGYLSVTSPTKRCGKTRLAEILELLCARPLMSVNVSEAALFRSIAEDQPTVIIDEAEALRNRNSERSQYLLSILQAGFRKGAVVLRCVGQDHEVEKFPVYCPKIVLAIGSFPDTLRDRSVLISMRQRLPDEELSRFRRRIAAVLAAGTVHAVSVWADAHKEEIAKSYSKQKLDFLQDREADIWDPLFAIASVACPTRLKELEQIALRLSGEKIKLDVDDSQNIRLLADIRTIFEGSKLKSMATGQLIFKLKGLPAFPRAAGTN